ncbi:MAG: hypothetical protein ACKPHM_13645 [Dolichospermum sp.]
MNVLVIETKTGKVVATVPVLHHGMNYTPSEQEYFSEAWQCAVEDNIVEADRRFEYGFQLVHPT